MLFANVMVGHRCNAGVRPYVFGCLYHVYDGIYGKYYSHNCNRRTYARHEREGEEEATHRHSGITYRRDHRKQEPKEHCGKGELYAAVLHHEERGDEDECRTAIHVDCGADGQYETCHP